LSGTLDHRLNYVQSAEGIRGFADADWAGSKIDRRSYTGYIFLLSGSAICWESRKQKSVATASRDSEYVALSEATKELMYLRTLMTEFGLNNLSKIVLFNDNIPAELMAPGSVSHNRRKHIDFRHHFVQEKLKENVFELKHVESEKNAADALTKALTSDKLKRCMNAIGLVRD